MIVLISFLSFASIFILVYILLRTYAPTEGPVEIRLRALDSTTAERVDLDEELEKPFAHRILSPLTSSMAGHLRYMTPKAIRNMVQEKMTAAGGLGGMGPDEFLLMTGFLAVALPVVTAVLATLANAPPNKIVGFSMYALALGTYMPFLMLNRKIASRRESMERDLPDVLDLLTVSVEAGLGFDGALQKLTEKMKGALVDEFSRLLQQVRIGIPKREALLEMGTRCSVQDISIFTTAVIQADQLGVSIGNVLRVQSAAMREKRKQKAQEQAMKAPIKLLLPLVLFIFPTIFIILLGPAVIQVLATFTNINK